MAAQPTVQGYLPLVGINLQSLSKISNVLRLYEGQALQHMVQMPINLL